MRHFSRIIQQIIFDLADNRKKEYSPEGKMIGPHGGHYDYRPDNTSINSSKPSSGITKAVKMGLIKPGDRVLDYGGGKFDAGKNHIESSIEGTKVFIFDPFSRSKEHNESVMGEFKDKKADIVMNHNVLNVIPTPEERREVITSAFDHVKPGGSLLLTVYVGNKSGVGNKVVKKNGWNWQENRPTADYVDEVQKALPDAKVVKKGELIIISR